MLKRCLLNDTLLCREGEVATRTEVLQDHRCNRDFAGLNLYARKIDDRDPLVLTRRVWNLVHLRAEAATLIREEEGPVVRVRNLERLHCVLFAGCHAAHALPAAMLLAVCGERLALDVAATADRDHHILVGNEILVRHLAGCILGDSRAALVAELLLHLCVLRRNDLGDALRIGEDVLQLLDQRKYFQVLVFNLLALECGEPRKAHVKDRLRLQLAQFELGHQLFARNIHICGGADRLDHCIKVVQRNLQAFQDVRALLCLLQFKLGAAADDDAAVFNVVLQHRLE